MPRILLVEDNEMNRDTLSRRLMRSGFEVDLDADGEQVLARAGAVDMVVGCSAGAIDAGLMASGHAGATAASMTTRLWTKEVTRRRNNRGLLWSIAPKRLGFDAARFGLRDDTLINERLPRTGPALGCSQARCSRSPRPGRCRASTRWRSPMA